MNYLFPLHQTKLPYLDNMELHVPYFHPSGHHQPNHLLNSQSSSKSTTLTRSFTAISRESVSEVQKSAKKVRKKPFSGKKSTCRKQDSNLGPPGPKAERLRHTVRKTPDRLWNDDPRVRSRVSARVCEDLACSSRVRPSRFDTRNHAVYGWVCGGNVSLCGSSLRLPDEAVPV
ncbi:hypothetical protein ElyMa_002750200 [Elysia marginata]|uniref:Uncharacterized protein n=1 Tax=Elysia marginata TaxID=1093978 RepID=A0AAV4HHL4_9GAST|nr:hypothetical protein ElyMa_002750200 [Elysia marginata]